MDMHQTDKEVTSESSGTGIGGGGCCQERGVSLTVLCEIFHISIYKIMLLLQWKINNQMKHVRLDWISFFRAITVTLWTTGEV